MITFDETTKIIKLDTPDSSYVMGIADNNYLGHVYYGKKLNDTNLSYLMRTEENPFVPSENLREKVTFFDSFPMEYPCGGLGDYRESALVVSCNGQEGAELSYVSHEIFSGKKELKGLPATWGDNCDTAEITMRDDVLGLKVILSYTAFSDTDAIARSVRLVNEGSEPLYLKKVLSASVDMEDKDFEFLSLFGSWARERNMETVPVGHAGTYIESLRGESGHQEHPFFALTTKGCTQTNGEVYGFHFVYSGNFVGKAQTNQFGNVRASMGIHPEHFTWKLEPGKEFTAPEVILVYSGEGLGKMTRTYHDLYRNHLIRSPWKDKKRPVLINNWEATYFEFDEEKLLDIAKEASKAGIEMLVMDDGWFGHRNSDNSSLGDWQVNENKIRGGLENLVEHVRELGMEFGIWFEPEMISPDSELYCKHPEWALQFTGRAPGLAREQLVLDFSRPEVLEYVYESVASILRSAHISYVKWDMNRPLADAGSSYLPEDRQGEVYHRHVLGLYELQERLIREFPNLLLENCSGGGARFDPGMLYYSPQIWCSDDTDAVERLMIQEGTQLIYPLSVIGAHVSDCPNHITGRVTPFETRGIVAMAGTFGYELDITKISEEDREQIPGQVETFKKYYPLINAGDYYRLASYRENHIYDCYQVVSKDKKQALITFVQVMVEPNIHSRKIYLQGLLEDTVYEVEGKRYTGNVLMHAGLLVPALWGDYQAKLIEVLAV